MLKKYLNILMHLIIRIALRICQQIGSIILENKVWWSSRDCMI